MNKVDKKEVGLLIKKLKKLKEVDIKYLRTYIELVEKIKVIS